MIKKSMIVWLQGYIHKNLINLNLPKLYISNDTK